MSHHLPPIDKATKELVNALRTHLKRCGSLESPEEHDLLLGAASKLERPKVDIDSTDLWISVSDRLPKRPWRVLVAYKKRFRKDRLGARYEIFDARYSGGAWRFLAPALKSRLSERVTHWQPLPRAPQ